MCPMRFNRFPLDEHICKFRVGSVNYDETRMTFSKYVLDYKPDEGTTILDYQVNERDGATEIIGYSTYRDWLRGGP